MSTCPPRLPPASICWVSTSSQRFLITPPRPRPIACPSCAQPGQFVERHWLPTNKPVLGPAGEVQYLIHHVVDVTQQVQAEAELRQAQASAQAAHNEHRLLHDATGL